MYQGFLEPQTHIYTHVHNTHTFKEQQVIINLELEYLYQNILVLQANFSFPLHPSSNSAWKCHQLQKNGTQNSKSFLIYNTSKRDSSLITTLTGFNINKRTLLLDLLKTFRRSSKLVIFRTLFMTRYGQQNRWYQLVGLTFVFIQMQVINLIPHFFLEIRHFKESCNLVS